MHNAFESHTIVEWQKMPFRIEAIATFGIRLLIGTSEGKLLIYDIPNELAGSNFDVKLITIKKEFSKAKKPISQLNIVEEFNILLSMIDGYVHIHSLKNFEEIARMEKSKGCTAYAIDVQVRGAPHMDTHRSKRDMKMNPAELCVRLAVVIKRKILTFEWDHVSEVFEECKEVSVAEVGV